MKFDDLSKSGLSAMKERLMSQQCEGVATFATPDAEGNVAITTRYADGKAAYPARINMRLLSKEAQRQLLLIITKDWETYQLKGDVASVLQPSRY